MDDFAGVLASGLGRAGTLVPSRRIGIALEAAAGADKRLAISSNGVPARTLGVGMIQKTKKEKHHELHEARSSGTGSGSQRDRTQHAERQHSVYRCRWETSVPASPCL